MQEDKFQITISPIYLNHTEYDNTTYIFTNKCSPKIIFYSIAIVQIGSETIPVKIWKVMIMKCVRSWFFFLSLLLLTTIIYFIICEIYVKFLIVPIKDVRAKLEKMIKERNVSNILIY